jgi:hypothetical protein
MNEANSALYYEGRAHLTVYYNGKATPITVIIMNDGTYRYIKGYDGGYGITINNTSGSLINFTGLGITFYIEYEPLANGLGIYQEAGTVSFAVKMRLEL